MASDPAEPAPTATERVQLLFVQHEGAIRAFIRALQPSLPEADDVLQETFLTVSRKAADFDMGPHFVAWACRIARFKVLESQRRLRKTTSLSEAALNALADAAPAPSELAAREGALRECLKRLAPRARDLLWRRYSVRQSSEVMAEEAGMSCTAVRVALTKARAFLRDCVAKELKRAH